MSKNQLNSLQYIQEMKDWLFISAINKELKVQDRDLLHFCGEKKKFLNLAYLYKDGSVRVLWLQIKFSCFLTFMNNKLAVM